MTNMQNLIDRIRIKINDQTAFEFQDDELVSYIYEGLSMLEILLLSNNVQFNITYLLSAASICPVPEDMLKIYKITNHKNEIPLKDITDLSYGYYILNNYIILPCTNAEIYYIKEFERYGIKDNINLPAAYIEYLYNNAVIRALSRLEFNMENEKNELMQLSSLIIKTALNNNSIYQLKRYNGYYLWKNHLIIQKTV